MATTSKSPSLTDWILTRWLAECEKSHQPVARSAAAKSAPVRELPVRFMFGINAKNVIVPILHRATAPHRDAVEQRPAVRLQNKRGEHGR